MISRVSIYYNSEFKFYNGIVGNKLLVLLNTPMRNQEFLFVTTTSRRKRRMNKPGCGKYYQQGEYFIKKGQSGFDKDTWLILCDIYPFKAKDIDDNPNFHRLKCAVLSEKTMRDVIDCLFKHHEDDIPEIYEDMLRPPMTASLLELARHFND